MKTNTARPRSASGRSTRSTRSTLSVAPDRDASPHTQQRRSRVSFRDEDDLEGQNTSVVEAVYPALSKAEYDREPIKADISDKDAVYDELIIYCEQEMCVNRCSKESAIHVYLRPGGQKMIREMLGQRVKQLNAMQRICSQRLLNICKGRDIPPLVLGKLVTLYYH